MSADSETMQGEKPEIKPWVTEIPLTLDSVRAVGPSDEWKSEVCGRDKTLEVARSAFVPNLISLSHRKKKSSTRLFTLMMQILAILGTAHSCQETHEVAPWSNSSPMCGLSFQMFTNSHLTDCL